MDDIGEARAGVPVCAHAFTRTISYSSTVTHAVHGHFLSPTSLDVVFAKENVLELLCYDSSDEALVSVCQQPVFGLVRGLCKLLWVDAFTQEQTPSGVDLVAAVSDSGYLSLVRFDPSESRFVVAASVCVSTRPGVCQKVPGAYVCAHPRSLAIAVSAFEKSLAVYPIGTDVGLVSEEGIPFTVDGIVWSMEFFEHSEGSVVTLALLFNRRGSADNTVLVIDFDLTQRSVLQRAMCEPTGPASFALIAPPPGYCDQVLLLQMGMMTTVSRHMGKQSSMVILDLGTNRTLATELVLSCWAWGKDRCLYAVTDDGHLVRVTTTLHADTTHLILGECTLLPTETPPSPATTLLALPEGVFVRAGEMCDGEVFRMTPSVPVDSVVSIQPLPNIGPVWDFAMADVFEERRDQMFLCSGSAPNGCVRVLRNGAKVTTLGSTGPDYLGLTNVWCIKLHPADTFHSYLVMTFVGATRVLSASSTLSDISDVSGFKLDRESLYVGMTIDGMVVQVLEDAVLLIRPMGAGQVPQIYEWIPEQGSRIGIAAGAGAHVIVTLSNNTVALLEVIPLAEISSRPEAQKPHLEKVDSLTLDFEPCCIEIPPHDATNARRLWGVDGVRADELCILGTYGSTVELIMVVPRGRAGTHSSHCRLRHIASERLLTENNEPSIADSIRVAMFGELYVIAGLRNGCMLTYEWAQGGLASCLPQEWLTNLTSTVKPTRAVINNGVHRRAGIEPIRLVPLQQSFLALSDRPWLIQAGRTRIINVAVGFTKVGHAAFFSCEECPEGCIMIADNCLHIVSIDESTALTSHVLGKLDSTLTPVRVMFDDATHLLVVAAESEKPPGSTLMLMDPISGGVLWKTVLTERILCLKKWVDKAGQDILCVGTANERRAQLGSTGLGRSGGLSIFRIRTTYRSATDTQEDPTSTQMELEQVILQPDPVHCLCAYQDNVLLISTGDKLKAYKWDDERNDRLKRIAAVQSRNTIVAIRSHFTRIAVADRRESVLFYRLVETTGPTGKQMTTFEAIHGDRSCRMMQDCVMPSDEFVIGIDTFGGMFSLPCDESMPGEENLEEPGPEKNLTAFCYFSTGETSARLQMGSICGGCDVQQLSVIACSMLGSVIASIHITPSEYEILSQVENVLRTYEHTRPLLGNMHQLTRSEGDRVRNVIDGTLVNQFLDLSRSRQDRVLALMPLPLTHMAVSPPPGSHDTVDADAVTVEAVVATLEAINTRIM